MNQHHLDTQLTKDSAQLLALIASIAPLAGLTPAETARIDQLAATRSTSHTKH